MYRTQLVQLVLGLMWCAAVPACGEDESPNDSGAEELPPASCAADYPEYRDGLTAKAGELTVRLLSATPAPPRQKVPNDWVIEVVGADGLPASNVMVESPDSYMPVHFHHGKTLPKVVALSEPSKFQIDDIDFRMRGPWQVNFDVVVAGGKPSPTTFQVCVQ